MNPSLRGLYAIADTQFLDDAQLVPAVEAAIAGGARAVQYRDKQHPPEIRRRHAKKISDLCRRHGVPFSLTMTSPWQWKPEPTACISG